MAKRPISTTIEEHDYNFIKECCQGAGQSMYSFFREAIIAHVQKTSAERDDQQAFDNALTAAGYGLGDDGTLATVLIAPDGKEEPFPTREDALSFLLDL